ncbi:hypothetical protein Btru_040058 [Bulinus truncatus]|nr:hypothetical protein Btru_040058 [Bulinus truncatus]
MVSSVTKELKRFSELKYVNVTRPCLLQKHRARFCAGGALGTLIINATTEAFRSELPPEGRDFQEDVLVINLRRPEIGTSL